MYPNNQIIFKSNKLIIKYLGLKPYLPILKQMEDFTDNKINNKSLNVPPTPNEIWLLEHSPVYTQGKNGNPEHILKTNNIPIITTSRGGQITYHGPGQLIIYFLFNLKSATLNNKNINLNMGPRQLVNTIENIIIKLLNTYNIKSHSNPKAPGIYIDAPDNPKIASIGLRIKNGHSFHGLSLNINMDLKPFSYINPCGYKNLKITQIKKFIPNINIQNVIKKLIPMLEAEFG